MASAVTLKMVGNWNKQVGAGLRDALAVSMDVTGRTGEQACRHALILMAQSARHLTKQSRKNRKVQNDPAVKGIGGQFVEVLNRGNTRPAKLYRLQYLKDDADGSLGTWESAKTIGNRGLAKRSWMWGLSRIGAKKTGKQIPGGSRFFTITSPKVNGYVKENRLDYIQKAMPAGWERMVEVSAGNKIMAQARNKLERKWRREMGMPKFKRGMTRASSGDLSKYFLKGMAA